MLIANYKKNYFSFGNSLNLIDNIVQTISYKIECKVCVFSKPVILINLLFGFWYQADINNAVDSDRVLVQGDRVLAGDLSRRPATRYTHYTRYTRRTRPAAEKTWLITTFKDGAERKSGHKK